MQYEVWKQLQIIANHTITEMILIIPITKLKEKGLQIITVQEIAI